jgi:DNA-binding transcriptional ArsR family regulator
MRKALQMANDPRPVIDQRLFRAVAHPNRIAILEALIDNEGLSLSQISERLGVRAANVNYHLNVLTSSGAIESVPGGPHAERTDQLFRISLLSLVGNQNWREISASLQDDVSTALLRSVMDRTANFPPDYDGRGA